MLKIPALDPMSIPPRISSGYPEPYRSRVLPREKRALGNAVGLTKIGINHTTLPPGKESSMRHWHTREDEFIFVLSGDHSYPFSRSGSLAPCGTSLSAEISTVRLFVAAS